MPRTLSDILRRFRPAVAPGSAGPVGVPADRVVEAEAELAPVFAALAPATAEAERMREQARADAQRSRREALEQAERVVAEARARVDSMRAEAASGALTALDEERATVDRVAQDEANRVRSVADERVPAVVAKVMAGVWATAGMASAGAVPPGREQGTG